MHYDFDQVICRKNTNSSKWDNVKARVGNAEAIPMWVTDLKHGPHPFFFLRTELKAEQVN